MVAIVGLGVAVPSHEITRVYIGDKARSRITHVICETGVIIAWENQGKPTFIG